MITNISIILSKFKKEIVEEINPIYFRIYLMKQIKKKKFINSLTFENNVEDIEDYIIAVSKFLGFVDENNNLTPLGKYFLFSTNIIEDFFKILMINDEDFRNFIIDLDENPKNIDKLQENYLSGFFRVVPSSLTNFFVSIGLIIEGSFNFKLIKTWKRQKTPISNRISNIFLNIINKVNPSDFIENLKKIIDKFNEEQSFNRILDENHIELIINFEEFEVFKQKLEIFFNSYDFNLDTDSSFFSDSIIKESRTISTPNRDISSRNHFLRNLLVSLYNGCQICEALVNKIPKILMKNNEPYLEVHHIIPISMQNKSEEQWEKKYSKNDNFKDFKNNLDNLKNMITLCAHHHAFLHYEFPQWKFIIDEKNMVYFHNGKEKINIKILDKHYI